MPGHPSRAFPLTVAIIRQFVQEAHDRGKRPIVVVFPTDEDFRFYKKKNKFVYEPLIREFKEMGFEYIDLGPELLKRLGRKDYLELFLGGQYRHFNRKGNRLTAEILFDYFQARGIIPSGKAAGGSG